MDEQQKAAFLAQFVPGPSQTLLGFAVMGGVFGEGVDLTGDRLIGVGIVGPGLPQVGPRQEQLRDSFERLPLPRHEQGTASRRACDPHPAGQRRGAADR